MFNPIAPQPLLLTDVIPCEDETAKKRSLLDYTCNNWLNYLSKHTLARLPIWFFPPQIPLL